MVSGGKVRARGRTRRGDRWATVTAAGSAAVAAVAALIATSKYGIGLSPDSVVYLEGARSLADGHGYRSAGASVTVFAPGYSAVLAVGDRLGLDAARGARALAVVCIAAAVLLGHVLLRRHVSSARTVAVATIAIATSAVLLLTYDEALSEHLFVLVVLGFVLAAEKLEEGRHPARWTVALVALAWAAFYLRYAGVVFSVLAALVVAIAGWRRSGSRVAGRTALTLAAALALPAVWMLRNLDAGSGPLGARQDASASFVTNVGRMAHELGRWVTTDWLPDPVQIGACVAVMVLLLCVGYAVWRGRVEWPPGARALVPLALVAAVYVAYLTVTASIVAFAAIQIRFVAPVFVPVVVLAAWCYEQVEHRVDGVARVALVGVTCVWLVASGAWFVREIHTAVRDGAGGYATRSWHDSPLLRDVRRLDSSVPLYSNDAAAIRVLTGREARLSVEKTHFASTEPTGSLPAFLRAVSCAGHVELAWFEPNTRPRLYAPEELARHLVLTARVHRPDGVIYDVSPLPGAPRVSNCR